MYLSSVNLILLLNNKHYNRTNVRFMWYTHTEQTFFYIWMVSVSGGQNRYMWYTHTEQTFFYIWMVSVYGGQSGICVCVCGGQGKYVAVNREFGVRVGRTVGFMWVFCVYNLMGFGVIVYAIMVIELWFLRKKGVDFWVWVWYNIWSILRVVRCG